MFPSSRWLYGGFTEVSGNLVINNYYQRYYFSARKTRAWMHFLVSVVLSHRRFDSSRICAPEYRRSGNNDETDLQDL